MLILLIIYIILHNWPLPPVDGIHNFPPPNLKMHPMDSKGANVLPNESYFLPLADWDNELERLVSKYMMRMSECYLTKRGHNVFIVQWLNCHLLLYSVSKTLKNLWHFNNTSKEAIEGNLGKSVLHFELLTWNGSSVFNFGYK